MRPGPSAATRKAYEKIQTSDILDRLRILGSDSTISAANIIEDQHAEIERMGAEIERLQSKLAQLESETDALRRDLPA